LSSSYSYFGTSAVETLYSLAVLAAMADLFVVVAMIAVLRKLDMIDTYVQSTALRRDATKQRELVIGKQE
jgi:hypothetical protein